jgi:hypothetical protein
VSIAWTLVDYENQVLLALREMDLYNFGGVPTFSAQFPKTLIDQCLNQAVADTVMMAGFAPSLTDRIVSVPVTTTIDVPVPTDLVGLQRLEYQQAGLVPYPLEQLTASEYDDAAGVGYPGPAAVALGLPTAFREPIGKAVRVWPQIGTTQVVAGDALVWTYSSYGLQMVANTDTAALPVGFQRGIVFGAVIDLWRVKGDEEQATSYERRWIAWCNEARKYRWNLPESGSFGVEDQEADAFDEYGRGW